MGQVPDLGFQVPADGELDLGHLGLAEVAQKVALVFDRVRGPQEPDRAVGASVDHPVVTAGHPVDLIAHLVVERAEFDALVAEDVGGGRVPDAQFLQGVVHHPLVVFRLERDDLQGHPRRLAHGPGITHVLFPGTVAQIAELVLQPDLEVVGGHVGPALAQQFVQSHGTVDSARKEHTRFHHDNIAKKGSRGKIGAIPSCHRTGFVRDFIDMENGVSVVPFESVFERSLSAIAVHTVVLDRGRAVDYVFDAVNAAFVAMTGLRAADLLGKSALAVFPSIDPKCIERYGRVALTGVPDSFEAFSESSGRWYQVSAFQHRPLGFSATFIDVTQRMLEHRRAVEEAAKHRAFFALPNGIKLVIDPVSRTILEANPKAAQFYGWSLDELKGMSLDQINTLSPEEISREMELARTQQRDHFRFRHRLRNGEIREIEVFSCPGVMGDREALFSIIHDVTETLQMQQQLLQRERLSAVGQMTASLYHEFGNLLGTLFAQIQLMAKEMPENEEKQKLEAKVNRQFQRAQKLVESVKRFSRTQEIELQTCRLSPLLEDLVDLESPQCAQTGITIDFHPAQEDWVRIDAALVQQVFLNLFRNAVQAVAEAPEPRISIDVRREDSDVVVRFANNGVEIPQDVKSKLFTPFFTTKNQGETKGTGLGLWFSWTVIQGHRGSLILEEGSETAFVLRLPQQSAEA